MSVYDEIQLERDAAHRKHGETSMEHLPLGDMVRLSVLMEEVGEVAREFNEAALRAHNGLLPELERSQSVSFLRLRDELLQVAAMAAAWADNITVDRMVTEKFTIDSEKQAAWHQATEQPEPHQHANQPQPEQQ